MIPEYDIRFEFVNDDTNSSFELTYRLFDRDFSARWLKLFKHAVDKQVNVQDNGVFCGTALNDEATCVAEMTATVNQINKHIAEHGLNEHYIELEPHIGMSQEFLNDMHKRFEILRYEKGFEDEAVQKHLANLNTEVHQCESFLIEGFKGCHVEVNFADVEYRDFEEEDYQLFTPDRRFGYLYLTYGVTGVPIEAAFYAKPKDPPLPQPNYCSGCFLYFNNSYDFPYWKKLGQWLKETWDLDVNDPKLAIGYIPLGELITPYRKPEDIVSQIAAHQKLVKITLISRDKGNGSAVGNEKGFFYGILQKLGLKKAPPPMSDAPDQHVHEPDLAPDFKPAIWPSHPEIKHHLNFKPYIELDIVFDTNKMLKEALAVVDKFVSHRNYTVTSDNKAEWKSIGLQAIDGDYSKTSYHTNYGITDNPDYRLTEIADQCPETIKFLSRLTDFKECERVRFMLLEPGAKIHVHRDSDDDVCTAVNISLNMPPGCKFMADVNEDGSPNPYSVEIPFKDSGSVVLFNNAKYHFVENNSDQPRMHIIYHGPIRYPEQSIIRDARKQNGFTNDREVLQALIRKKYDLGEEIKPHSDFYKDWKTLGISPDIIPDAIKKIVVDESLEDNEFREECLYKITGASIFPLDYEIVNSEKLDEWMADLKEPVKHLVIIGSGLLVNDVNRFVLEIFRSIALMKKEKAMISGQIINQQHEIPYLHEQFMVLDVELWKEEGKVPLGQRYSDEAFEFPPYQASEETIHDDYTPLYIIPDPSGKSKQGKKWWGTELLAANIKNGIKVINVSPELRETKKYAYPTAKDKQPYEEVRKDIQHNLEYINKQVFFFNNEQLAIRQLDFQPVRLITVAAGFKPVGILHQYWPQSQPESIHVIDYSEKAIEYLKQLADADNPTVLFDNIAAFMKEHPYGSVLNDEQIRNHLRAVISECFDNDIDLLVTELEKFQQADFTHADFIQHLQAVVDLFDKDHPTIFWHSNAWSCNGILYKMTPKEIENNYHALIKAIQAKLDCKAWKHQNGFEVIFGESLDNVHSLMTEGAGGQTPNKNEWHEV